MEAFFMLPYTSNSEGLCSSDKWISSLITAAQFLRWVSVLDPHADPHGEMSGASERMFVPFSPTLFLFLHDLRHEIAHLFGGTFLHLPCDVGVGSQCESRVEMTEHTGYCFHVYAILQRQGCECVT